MSSKPFDKTLGIGLIICAVLITPGIIYLTGKPDQNTINICTFLGLGSFLLIGGLFFRTFGRVMSEYDEPNYTGVKQ